MPSSEGQADPGNSNEALCGSRITMHATGDGVMTSTGVKAASGFGDNFENGVALPARFRRQYLNVAALTPAASQNCPIGSPNRSNRARRSSHSCLFAGLAISAIKNSYAERDLRQSVNAVRPSRVVVVRAHFFCGKNRPVLRTLG